MIGGPFAAASAELAEAGWAVLPVRGKRPVTPHGYLDASRDPGQIEAWRREHPTANIAAAVPDSLAVIDVDPRNGGDLTVSALEAEHGPLPVTLTVATGGGGRHLYFMRPAGPLRHGAGKLGPGVDVKLGGRGYVILPPSTHPVTGRRYAWVDQAVPAAPMPGWMAALLRPEPYRPRPARPVPAYGSRPGDAVAGLCWAEILAPAGWVHVADRGDVGYWRRPGARTDGIDATTNATGADRLHVFSPSAAPFSADESYTKFGAWTLLRAGGDFRAAARMLIEGVRA